MNEIVDVAKKYENDCIILKLDFEKDYDYFKWNFLGYMLVKFDFCDKWLALKHVLYENPAILVNVCLTQDI